MNPERGFTLVEMAIVLLIVTLLLGGLLMPLSAQVEQRKISETQKALDEIKEALIGFAIVNGRLPCPDNSGDGQEDACPTTSTSSSGGNVPWVTLGTASGDVWGRPYQYRVNGAFTATFLLTTSGSGSGVLRVCTDSACGTLQGNNVPAVVYSSGKNGGTQPPGSLDELENTTLVANPKFDRTFVSRVITEAGAQAGEFDDIVVWLSPNILFNRLVAAGKLP
jgi:prepilin-type N-terminal cleavage/methylation domain-containing protein